MSTPMPRPAPVTNHTCLLLMSDGLFMSGVDRDSSWAGGSLPRVTGSTCQGSGLLVGLRVLGDGVVRRCPAGQQVQRVLGRRPGLGRVGDEAHARLGGER